jgi:excinuclease ABC subunit C
MATAVKKEKFEQAQLLRDQINALQKLFQSQLINPDRIADPNYLEFLRAEETRELQTVIENGCRVSLAQLKRIEGYDISNLNFSDATASMVVFENGLPQKAEYRRFKIKGERRFDPEMLLEVLKRRLRHLEWPAPDLIVIDGGTPQILKVYPQLKVQYPQLCPVIGLAKNPDRVFCSQTWQYLSLKKDSLALHYLERLRDEAHRFAKKYHQHIRREHYPF